MMCIEIIVHAWLFVSALLLAVCALMNGLTAGFILMIVFMTICFLFRVIHTLWWEDEL